MFSRLVSILRIPELRNKIILTLVLLAVYRMGFAIPLPFVDQAQFGEVVKKLSHLPIVVDPSHGTGRRDKVVPMARAAVAAGADGLLIEVHDDPDRALSDGAQSLYPEQFDGLMADLRVIAPVVGRTVPMARVPSFSEDSVSRNAPSRLK